MADEIDLANDQAERFLNLALHSARAEQPRMPGRGCCYYCEATFDKQDPDFARKLFCDAECATDYETLQRQKNRR